MIVARVYVALGYDYLGMGKRTKEGDEKRDVVVSGKNRRRGEISSGVCRRRRVWLLAHTTSPIYCTTDGPREEGGGKNSYFLKRHDPLDLFVYSISELKAKFTTTDGDRQTQPHVYSCT